MKELEMSQLDSSIATATTALSRALSGQKTLVVGHRGLGISSLASQQLPENTLPSLQMAFIDGADMVELDVTLTWDSHVVVFHDDNLNRTTNGLGFIQNYSLNTIRNLDAGVGTIWEGKRVGLPTLEEVFTFMKDEDKEHFLNIEFKGYSGAKRQRYVYRRLLVDSVIQLVEEFNLADRIVFSSFDWRMLLIIKRKRPEYLCALLAHAEAGKKWTIEKMVRRAKSMGCEGIHPHFPIIRSKAEIEQAQKEKVFVMSYDLNNMDDFDRGLYFGLNGIITDYPGKLRKFLQTAQPVESNDFKK